MNSLVRLRAGLGAEGFCKKNAYFFLECFYSGVRVLKTRWKPHKSKDHNFLRRSYTKKISQLKNIYFCFSLEKKIKKFSPPKKIRQFLDSKWSKSENVDFGIFDFWRAKFSIFDETFFRSPDRRPDGRKPRALGNRFYAFLGTNTFVFYIFQLGCTKNFVSAWKW